MKLLVYGTLKKDYGNHRYLENSKFVKRGEFKINGCQLRADRESPFPYLYKKSGVRSFPFYGEMYEIDDETLRDIDILEGHPSFYQRIFIKEYDCYTYVCSEDYVKDLDIIYKFL